MTSPWLMKDNLLEIASYYPKFQIQTALAQLKALNAVDPEMVDEVSNNIDSE